MYKLENLKESGITLTENLTSLKWITDSYTISIPCDWVLEERAKSNCSHSSGDIIQMVLASIHGYDTIRGWENYMETVTTSEADYDGYYYRYHMPVKVGKKISY